MKRATFEVVLKNPTNHFNARPREEGDSYLTTFGRGILYFNPRPREEGDGQ